MFLLLFLFLVYFFFLFRGFCLFKMLKLVACELKPFFILKKNIFSLIACVKGLIVCVCLCVQFQVRFTIFHITSRENDLFLFLFFLHFFQYFISDLYVFFCLFSDYVCVSKLFVSSCRCLRICRLTFYINWSKFACFCFIFCFSFLEALAGCVV